MLNSKSKYTWLTGLMCLIVLHLQAAANKFRIAWVDDPATTAVIAWNQVSGGNPMLHLDINDYGQNANDYAVKRRPDQILQAKGLNNHFVRLAGLKPATTYFFLIKDNEGIGKRYFFTTAPSTPNERLSIIAGGDSRNHRDARQEANMLVAKLRPHCVMFGGDFTENDTPQEWAEWMDDWQLTFSSDGRITPLIVTRGNHEESNQTLIDLFGVKTKGAYYALTLGGSLLRIYTLNSLVPVSGEQRDWLESDLRASAGVVWKVAQYHHPMRPHTLKKAERNDMIANWAPLFLQYGVNLAVECDAHVVKSTWPIRPGNGEGSTEGFIRDDEAGTVYIGEGCWGAPLRDNNDNKAWTRAAGSFNQFHWIFVDREKIEVRFVKTDGADRVAEVNPRNIFSAPRGLTVWSPPNGDVVTIGRPGLEIPVRTDDLFVERGNPGVSRGGGTAVTQAGMFPAEKPAAPQNTTPPAQPVQDETGNWDICPQLLTDPAAGEVKIKYSMEESGDVVIRVINLKLQEVTRLEFPDQAPGEHLKSLKMSHLAAGRYLAIVKSGKKVLRRFRVLKKE